jgi:hypothetical protein
MTATGPIKNPSAYSDPFARDSDLYSRPRSSSMHGDIPMDDPRPAPRNPDIDHELIALIGDELAAALGRSAPNFFRDRRPLWMQKAGIQYTD